MWLILGSGGWADAGFRAFLSLQEDEEAVLKALLVEIHLCKGSEDEYPPDEEYTLGETIHGNSSSSTRGYV